MAAQSFAMGHAFGSSFQYGKRKISSMTNEEFNALSATDLHGQLQADIRAMIPDMNRSFQLMEQFQIDIINSMVNTLKIAAAQFFEWITTGRVTSGGPDNTQTDTSATNIDFTGGVFDIQGGSRQDNALTSDNPNSNLFKNAAGQTYEEWLAFNKVDETVLALKKKTADNKARVERDIQRSRDAAKRIQPFIKKDVTIRSAKDPRQFKSPAEHLATAKKNKAALITNIRSAEAFSKLKQLETKRMKIRLTQVTKMVAAGRMQSRTKLITTRAYNQLRKINAEAIRKVNNLKRLLRNYKI